MDLLYDRLQVFVSGNRRSHSDCLIDSNEAHVQSTTSECLLLDMKDCEKCLYIKMFLNVRVFHCWYNYY